MIAEPQVRHPLEEPPTDDGGTRYAYVKEGLTVSDLDALNPNDITDGPDVFVAELMFRLPRSELLVLARWGNPFKCDRWSVSAQPVHREGRSRFWTVLETLLSPIAVYRALRAYAPSRIVCGSLGGWLWASLLYSKLHCTPLVHSTHVRVYDSMDSFARRVRAMINLWCMRRAGAVVCHGPYLRNHLVQMGFAAHMIVEYEIHLDKLTGRIGPSCHTALMESDRPTVLFVGRLDEQKGVVDLLRAMEPHLRSHPPLRLVYAGGGSASSIIRDLARVMGLTEQVELLGQIAHLRLVQVVRDAGLVVTPTRRSFPEGRCMAAVEALALGSPVVAPNFGPFPFAVRPGENGLLYEPDSVADLSDCIGSIINEPKLYARIKAGAQSCSESLFESDLTFSRAVESAFQKIESGLVPSSH